MRLVGGGREGRVAWSIVAWSIVGWSIVGWCRVGWSGVGWSRMGWSSGLEAKFSRWSAKYSSQLGGTGLGGAKVPQSSSLPTRLQEELGPQGVLQAPLEVQESPLVVHPMTQGTTTMTTRQTTPGDGMHTWGPWSPLGISWLCDVRGGPRWAFRGYHCCTHQ